MNYKDITAIIVTFKSQKIIFKCLNSIKFIEKIMIIDNSNDHNLKKKILSKFPKINFILSKKNLGYGAANNIALKKIKTKYALILNPDTVLLYRCVYYLFLLAKKLKNNFSIIAPCIQRGQKNYGFFDSKKKTSTKIEVHNNYFKVDYVKGFAMFLNIRKIKSTKYFDENFFMYLEEIDLCKRLYDLNKNIFVSRKAKVKHIGAKSTNLGFDFEINRNWHWMWSKIYFSSKHNGFLNTRITAIPSILALIIQCLFNILCLNKNKFLICSYRLGGLLSAYFGLKSFFRIKL